MVKVRHQPLFNRRYLLILIWILPIVILVLHRSGQTQSPLDQLSWQNDSGYLLPNTEPGYRLTLILPSTNALSDEGWVQDQAVERALRTRLDAAQTWLDQQQWRADLHRSGSYLALRLRMQAQPKPVQQQQLLSLLAPLPALDWPALTRRLRAERYLQSQPAEDRLLAAFGQQLEPSSDIGTAYSRLWQPPHRWILVGDVEIPEQTTSPSQADRYDRSGWQSGELLIPDTGSSRLDTGWQLIAQSIPAPTNGVELARQRLSAELVSHLLARTLAANADYRWLWQPLVSGGYHGLLLHNWPDDPSAMGEQLARHLDQALLDTTRDTLLQQLARIEQESPGQWLDLVALYRLPLDSHKAFRDTLTTLNLAQARQLLRDTLRPAQSLLIRFDTAGH
ncbi:hypothetical protein GCM10011352_38930 [Marinobacterium zhoushanense]|uniref:Uncharacterized protein n=1 Tax=Marinobacterium zhoushanense TaxID=1679163 RepID=A0ABQ1KUD7_9GAMM|nr:hypothetical protein [Marinobacterium zhoushanense]GGC08779.1 hypothetical protein GCM10011352_38930 [Marinobacterium zhoushanense]